MAYSHVVADLGGIGNHLGVVGEEAVIESDLIVARREIGDHVLSNPLLKVKMSLPDPPVKMSAPAPLIK